MKKYIVTNKHSYFVDFESSHFDISLNLPYVKLILGKELSYAYVFETKLEAEQCAAKCNEFIGRKNLFKIESFMGG
ncbi:hypothetical protein [Bacillus phage vB_Bpu_PumA2]|uniref:Uncharacterized protein n=1 Tax=Bacillus phage vB_Bpu_PumA2 TaxID=2662128 RepID=A0A5Q2WAA1_9CAUD|nr:hypothetical protein H3021_gp04 [Bacillus phage vB_Bpu_PumA2]QGH74223.1 hypothetical protein [Bacillus phage vB_Bpu_PumA2]